MQYNFLLAPPFKPPPPQKKINAKSTFYHTLKNIYMQCFISTSYSMKYDKYNINDI